MIFTQRFFTLLLGLLFATVLTDQASALYDPGVGRFCSRDPIGYEAGSNCLYEYCHDEPLNYIDPWGKQIMPPTGPSIHLPPQSTPYPPSPTPPNDPTWLIFGTGYGNWCGYFRAGQQGGPIDSLDRACQAHDYCVFSFKDFCLSWSDCARDLCHAAETARNTGCASDYAHDSIRRRDCEAAAWLVGFWACRQASGTGLQPTIPKPGY